MEERNTLLRRNLDALHWAECSGVVCLCLSLIQFVDRIAAVIAIVVELLCFVAVYRLRKVHEDYRTAFKLILIQIPLVLIADLMGGRTEAVIDLINSVIRFGQVYFIIQATNQLLLEDGRADVSQKGNKVIWLFVINAVVNVAAGFAAVVIGVSGVTAVLLTASLIMAIAAVVVYIQYLGTAKNCF